MSRLPAIRDALGLTPGQIGPGPPRGLRRVDRGASAHRLRGPPDRHPAHHADGGPAQRRPASSPPPLAVGAGSTPLVAALPVPGPMGIGAWDVSMNLQGTVVEHDLGRAIMPRFHAGFSLGAVAGAATGRPGRRCRGARHVAHHRRGHGGARGGPRPHRLLPARRRDDRDGRARSREPRARAAAPWPRGPSRARS